MSTKRQRQYSIAVRLYRKAQERYRQYSNRYRPGWITRQYAKAGRILAHLRTLPQREFEDGP